MWTKRLLIASAAVLALGATPAQAAKQRKAAATPHESPTPAAAAPQPRPVQPFVAEVKGTIPDALAGTWLVIQRWESKRGYSNSWRAYRFAHNGPRWEVVELTGKAPPLAATIEDANKKMTPLSLDAETLKALGTVQLQPKPWIRGIKCTLTDAAHYPEIMAEKATSRFLIGFVGRGARSRNVAMEALSYWVNDITGDSISGSLRATAIGIGARGTVAPAGGGGTFIMYRLP
jgi:hypothetical protein